MYFIQLRYKKKNYRNQDLGAGVQDLLLQTGVVATGC